jgi:hypothetical protein
VSANPTVDGNKDLAGTYDTTMTYNSDGSMATMTLPAAGGLAKETLKYGYDALGRPQTLKGTSTYVADTGYDGLGNIATQVLATTTGANVQRTYTYETGTNRKVSRRKDFQMMLRSTTSIQNRLVDAVRLIMGRCRSGTMNCVNFLKIRD